MFARGRYMYVWYPLIAGKLEVVVLRAIGLQRCRTADNPPIDLVTRISVTLPVIHARNRVRRLIIIIIKIPNKNRKNIITTGRNNGRSVAWRFTLIGHATRENTRLSEIRSRGGMKNEIVGSKIS